MRRNLLSACFLVLLAWADVASASMMDFINGKMVGRRLQYTEMQFVGSNVDLNNKVVLIDFWATWCEPCQEFIPRLNQIHSDYAAKGLVVVGLTQDEPSDIAAFVKKIPINFHIARDINGEIFKHLKVRAMPYSILINKNGNIIWQGDPADLNKTQFDTLLNVL